MIEEYKLSGNNKLVYVSDNKYRIVFNGSLGLDGNHSDLDAVEFNNTHMKMPKGYKLSDGSVVTKMYIETDKEGKMRIFANIKNN